jgi:hypothetical protein
MSGVQTIAAFLLLLVELGSGYSGGEATGTGLTPDLIEVRLVVQVAESDGPVVVHLALPGEDVDTHPMLAGGEGRWTMVAELRPADWQVVFEALAAGSLSEPVSLTELGLDPDLLAVSAPTTDTPAPPEKASLPWWQLSVALAVAALAITVGLHAFGSLRPRHLRSPRSRRSASS